ncbi:MAG: DUF4338 domain-containing protein [Candidatus Methanomethylicaceae archaeon]
MTWDSAAPNQAQLRELVLASLSSQGFTVIDGKLALPARLTKEQIRHLHAFAVTHRVLSAKAKLARYETKFIKRIASGTEIEPSRVVARLVEVRRGSEDELLFRWVALHWSVPVSSGYGRRLRFLVEDANNGKLIGIIGLCDPVFSIAARDRWIGWDVNTKNARLRNVMEAYVLGAVPPYSMLLGGKLVAMLCAR